MYIYIWNKTKKAIERKNETTFEMWKQRYPDVEYEEVNEIVYTIYIAYSNLALEYRKKTGQAQPRNILYFLEEIKEFKNRNILPTQYDNSLLEEIKAYYQKKMDINEIQVQLAEDVYMMKKQGGMLGSSENWNNFADKTQSHNILVPNKTTPFALTTNAKMVIIASVNGITTATEHTSKKGWNRGLQIGTQGEKVVFVFNPDGTITNLGKIALIIICNEEDKE